MLSGTSRPQPRALPGASRPEQEEGAPGRGHDARIRHDGNLAVTSSRKMTECKQGPLPVSVFGPRRDQRSIAHGVASRRGGRWRAWNGRARGSRTCAGGMAARAEAWPDAPGRCGGTRSPRARPACPASVALAREAGEGLESRRDREHRDGSGGAECSRRSLLRCRRRGRRHARPSSRNGRSRSRGRSRTRQRAARRRRQYQRSSSPTTAFVKGGYGRRG